MNRRPHDALRLDPTLLETKAFSALPGASHDDRPGVRGRYNTFEFTLRLSQEVHERIAKLDAGIHSSRGLEFEDVEAFSTYLHETIHWWQHIGSTFGLIFSLTYPAEAHANHGRLKQLGELIGHKKSIRLLIEQLDGPRSPETPAGLANIIVNNQFDFHAYRMLTFSQATRESVVQEPLFEAFAHAFTITYGNVVHQLSGIADPEYKVLPNPADWNEAIHALREQKAPGFFYGSPVGVLPLGAREIMEGQARFAQIQYLHFGSGGNLDWDAFRELGWLNSGLYRNAFDLFLTQSGLDWPDTVDHPTVALFLLICDMAINPGAAFPCSMRYPQSFITDCDPGERFVFLSAAVRMFCPEVAGAITTYSFEEYERVSEALAKALKIDSPLTVARTVASWPDRSEGMAGLMREYESFEFGLMNLPIRVIFAHFIAFAQDKAKRPEVFVWPGAWMAGERVGRDIVDLFERHGALFVDKPGDNGVFPRLAPGRTEEQLRAPFERFFSGAVTYDLVRQWITEPGPFHFRYNWLVEKAQAHEMEAFADSAFKNAFGISLGDVQVL